MVPLLSIVSRIPVSYILLVCSNGSSILILGHNPGVRNNVMRHFYRACSTVRGDELLTVMYSAGWLLGQTSPQ